MSDNYDEQLKIRNPYLDLIDRCRWLVRDADVMKWGAEDEGWIHPSTLDTIQKMLDNIKATNDFIIKERNIKI